MAHSRRASERIVNLPVADYEADDVMVVKEPEQLKALGDDLRSQIVVLLREHARSTTELAELLDLPKGTVGHHVKVLEKAGLIRVVRTRKVRALTERYYGRTARLFLFRSSTEDGGDIWEVGAAALRRAAAEMIPAADDDRTTFGVLRARLSDGDARRFERRLKRLQEDFLALKDDPAGNPYGLAVALYRRAPDA